MRSTHACEARSRAGFRLARPVPFALQSPCADRRPLRRSAQVIPAPESHRGPEGVMSPALSRKGLLVILGWIEPVGARRAVDVVGAARWRGSGGGRRGRALAASSIWLKPRAFKIQRANSIEVPSSTGSIRCKLPR